MTISPIMGASYYNPYGAYNTYIEPSAAASSAQEQPAGAASSRQERHDGAGAAGRGHSSDAGQTAAQGMPGVAQESEDGRVIIRNPGESTEKQAGRNHPPQNARHARTANTRTVPTRATSPSKRRHILIRNQRRRESEATSKSM